jgi:trk system potassium uptake protein
MNVIIMGCGHVGAELASKLDAEKHNVTILDKDAPEFGKLSSKFNGTALVGDGTDEEVLKKAGIAQADAFVALTREDERNAMAAQIAKQMFNVPKVVCRIYDPLREEFYASLGLDAISPISLFVQLVKERLGA